MPAAKKLSLADVVEVLRQNPWLREIYYGDIHLVRDPRSFVPSTPASPTEETPPKDPDELKKYYEDILYQSA